LSKTDSSGVRSAFQHLLRHPQFSCRCTLSALNLETNNICILIERQCKGLQVQSWTKDQLPSMTPTWPHNICTLMETPCQVMQVKSLRHLMLLAKWRTWTGIVFWITMQMQSLQQKHADQRDPLCGHEHLCSEHRVSRWYVKPDVHCGPLLLALQTHP
jgi:hypothetical protein